MQMIIPRHLPNPHNGNRFPRIAHTDEIDGLLRTLINAKKNILVVDIGWIENEAKMIYL